MSNQAKHTAEPWHVGQHGLSIYDQYGWGVAGVTKHPHQVSGERTANARRIVACVNACRGLSTDELEKHGLVSAVGTELIELEKQREQLLAALEQIARYPATRSDEMSMESARDIARAAIAATKGGAE